jgi:putative endonuclease
MSYPQHISGRAAENFACEFLQKQGLQLLQRNYSCKLGEIDLVMQTAEYCIFVEVRFRRHRQYGGALESITPAKQRRLILAASHFLQQRPAYASMPCRFDVVAVSSSGQQYSAEWVQAAFTG